jgi:hypothetical protein
LRMDHMRRSSLTKLSTRNKYYSGAVNVLLTQ